MRKKTYLHPRLPSLLIAMSLALFLAQRLSAQVDANRTALLIANGDYKTLGRLSEPIPEARQLRTVLQSLGFSVTLIENASRDQMADALVDFQAALDQRAGIGFFHYGGHAVQIENRNYLIPATAEISDESRVSSRAISLEEVTKAVEGSRASTRIIILDACRDNPLPKQSGRSAARGLSVAGGAPQGTIIVYSAQAGATAKDGVFTPSLIRNLGRAATFTGVLQSVAQEVSQATGGAQRPFSYADLSMPSIYLSARQKTAPISPVAAPTPPIEARFPPIAFDLSGKWYLDFEMSGTVYRHSVTLSQTGASFGGAGGYAPGAALLNSWRILSGVIENDTLSIKGEYTSSNEQGILIEVFLKKDSIGAISGSWEQIEKTKRYGGTVRMYRAF